MSDLEHWIQAREQLAKDAHWARIPEEREQALLLVRALNIAITYASVETNPAGTLLRADAPHRCEQPPAIITWGDGPAEPDMDGGTYRPPVMLDRIPDGSTWTCEVCGRTRVVWTRPDQVGPTMVSVGGPEWREETSRERRRRLRAARRG